MKNTPIFALVFSILMLGSALTDAQAGAAGSLKHTTIDFPKENWKIIVNQPDSLGNPTFGIMQNENPVGLSLSEHPDSTTFIFKSVLLNQFEEKLRTQLFSFTPAGSTAAINTVVAPEDWSCKHYIYQSTAATPKIFQSNCIFIGSGYWVHMSLIAPIDVSHNEISNLNRVLKTIQIKD